MASAELIVAKAALTGALFRADPRSCSREDIESMLALLDTAIIECSPPNVQRFKLWALGNLVPSKQRVGSFCKYLVALASSFGADGEKARAGHGTQHLGGRLPSAKRRRLHILYILNDILYHAKARLDDVSFAEKLALALPSLVRSASSFSKAPKHIKKIRDLIALWEEQGYFGRDVVEKLRDAIDQAPLPAGPTPEDDASANSAGSIARAAKSAPYIMPSMHGDPKTPWYDLPAGNWLSVLEPNSTRPMNPSMIKPLVFGAGPADKDVVEAVKKLLVDVDKIYTKDVDINAPLPDISQMGEALDRDGVDNEVVGGETYYGWSRNFCEKMQARKRGGLTSGPTRDESRGRSRSRSSYSLSLTRSRSPRRTSESSARPAFKRSRLSGSSRSRSRGERNDSWSRSRSRSPRRGHRGYRNSRDHSSSRSPSEPRRRRSSRDRLRSQSYSPAPAHPTGHRPPSLGHRPPVLPPQYPPARPFPPMPPQTGFGNYHIPPPIPSQNFMPVPPHYPPPAPFQHSGAFPPPPPPLPSPSQGFAGFIGGWAPVPQGAVPPPPPPPPRQAMYPPYQHGRGGGNNYRGGRGGRSGGRW